MPRTSRARTLLSLLALAGLGLAGGCSSVIYDANPAGPPSRAADEPDDASGNVKNLLASSIRWASENYPPPRETSDGWIAFNLPAGFTRDDYIDVAERIGPRAAPITPDVEHLPTYHVGWVWMRGDHARVDVARPVYALSRSGDTVYQVTTLHLRQRYESWRVERTQPWEVGVVALPPIHYLPPPELTPAQQAAMQAESVEPEPMTDPAATPMSEGMTDIETEPAPPPAVDPDAMPENTFDPNADTQPEPIYLDPSRNTYEETDG